MNNNHFFQVPRVDCIFLISSETLEIRLPYTHVLAYKGPFKKYVLEFWTILDPSLHLFVILCYFPIPLPDKYLLYSRPLPHPTVSFCVKSLDPSLPPILTRIFWMTPKLRNFGQNFFNSTNTWVKHLFLGNVFLVPICMCYVWPFKSFDKKLKSSILVNFFKFIFSIRLIRVSTYTCVSIYGNLQICHGVLFVDYFADFTTFLDDKKSILRFNK